MLGNETTLSKKNQTVHVKQTNEILRSFIERRRYHRSVTSITSRR
jgi:hypothetical protein